jgi:tRNA(Arg) A34 adenosine deaminase TadA
MREAIKLMRKAGVVDKTGGPFGAVIAKDGKIIASSGNSVVQDNDPSGHAEVNAIRKACKAMGSVWLCDVHQLPMLPDVLLNSILGKAESNLLRLSLEGLLRLFPPRL